MKKYFPKFESFGFKVTIDRTWIFFAFLATWSLSLQYFPYITQGLSAWNYWALGLLGTLGLGLSILVHEISRSAFAKSMGHSLQGIHLFLYGSLPKKEQPAHDPAMEVKIAAIGPAVSLTLGFLFHFLLSWSRSLKVSAPISSYLDFLSTINFFLACFHFLPALPLDGGRAFRAILWKWTGSYGEANHATRICGKLLSWCFIAFSLLSFFSVNLVGALWWVSLGYFFHLANRTTRPVTRLEPSKYEKVAA